MHDCSRKSARGQQRQPKLSPRRVGQARFDFPSALPKQLAKASAHRVRFRSPTSQLAFTRRVVGRRRADRGRLTTARVPRDLGSTRCRLLLLAAVETALKSRTQPTSGSSSTDETVSQHPPLPANVARLSFHGLISQPPRGLYPPGNLPNRSSTDCPTRPDGADFSVQSGHGNPTRQCDSHSKLRAPHVEAGRPLYEDRTDGGSPEGLPVSCRHSRGVWE